MCFAPDDSLPASNDRTDTHWCSIGKTKRNLGVHKATENLGAFRSRWFVVAPKNLGAQIVPVPDAESARGLAKTLVWNEVGCTFNLAVRHIPSALPPEASEVRS